MKKLFSAFVRHWASISLTILVLGGVFLAPVGNSQSSGVMIANSQVQSLDFGDFVSGLTYSPDGSVLAAGGFNKQVRLWNTSNWEVLRELRHPATVHDVAFFPSMSFLAAITNDAGTSSVWFWDIKSGIKIGEYAETNKDVRITSFAFSPNNKLLAVGLNNGLVRLLDVENPALPKVIDDHFISFDTGISSLNFSSDGSLLAAGTGKGLSGPKDFGKLKVLEVGAKRELFTYTTLSIVYNLAFSPNGKILAVSGAEDCKNEKQLTLKIFNTKDWQQAESFNGHPVGAGLDFSENGRFLVSAFPNPPDSSIVVLDMIDKRVIRTFKTRKALTSLSISPKGKNIAVGDERGTIDIYSTK
jgi:WD40 repeat protein